MKSKLRPIDPEFWTVENELPDPFPFSTAELDAIERYFGGVLDAVFDSKPRALPVATTASQKGKKR
ncbi:hypothetical protein [Afipia sp. 1NLS2]|uniref:hypothetical protein n=1 Tax=Afipia sp. 1NLS2 TaxID=666684 RepID=UPI001FDAA0C6|nr:hypothetical protein [Afipia sp. 1NLS2]